MRTNDDSKPEGRLTSSQVALALFIAVIFLMIFVPVITVEPRNENQSRTASNCRQIIAALKLYASDHQGRYPDADASAPKTSNQVFRLLIREGYLEDERCFGARGSMFNPDNNIGEAPDFKETLEAGENHWAMAKGVTAKSSPRFPLVFENPTTSAWPPAWNCDAIGKKEKGRAWRGGKIIVGFNDGSVELITLESAKGTEVLPVREAHGKDVFTRASDSMDVLDILE